MGKDKMSRSLKFDFSSCLINCQSPNLYLSFFPFSFIPVPFKTCEKLEVILGVFGGLKNYYSLGPGNPGADSHCSELFPSPASAGVLRWQGMLSLLVPTQMCSAQCDSVPPALGASRQKLIKNEGDSNFFGQSQPIK